jgi:DNA-binding transcriptional ArsR family regulator
MNSIDPAALEGLTEIFRVLGDPTRLRILDALSRGELCVGDLATQLGVTESAVSHQLRLLRSARIVRARRDGRMIFYSLDDTHVLTLFEQGLRHVQEAGHGAPRPDGDGRLLASKPAGGGDA